jgi:hypothetical protein
MSTATLERPRPTTRSPRVEPMGTAEFLEYLATHPATSDLGRLFATIVAERET